MKISLIVCTYMRPDSLTNLLKTVETQTKIPDEIIIVDGSTDDLTRRRVNEEDFALPLRYFKVDDNQRGLTKQRNFGIERVSDGMEIVAFLDDDIELERHYFEEIEKTYRLKGDAVAVGGVSTNEVRWEERVRDDIKYFTYDGWSRRDDIRYRARKLLGLVSDVQPGRVLPYGHERSIGFLPPTGKIYETDFLMGGIASYRKKIFVSLSFSHFFDGYGLYEDKDFSLRIRRLGKIYINTDAKVEHHHDPLGRPNYYKYGQMVVWNGWRVWRVGNPNPSMRDRLKWWSITMLLTGIRLGNAILGPKERKRALSDFAGRCRSILRLIYSRPDMSDV